MSTTSLCLFLFSAASLAGCSPTWTESLDSGPAKGPAPVPGAAEPASAGADAVADPSDPKDKVEHETAIATFGAGCFWGVEAAYRQLKGVTATSVGFMGGSVPEPSYKQVCTDRTGHAEVVQVEYDPDKVSYDELLGVFWANHDPTTLNRQGPDVGAQYRSVIFFHTPEQEAAARRSLERQTSTGRFKRPIVTKIEPAGDYWLAEEYHQQYLEKRGLSTCHIGD